MNRQRSHRELSLGYNSCMHDVFRQPCTKCDALAYRLLRSRFGEDDTGDGEGGLRRRGVRISVPVSFHCECGVYNGGTFEVVLSISEFDRLVTQARHAMSVAKRESEVHVALMQTARSLWRTDDPANTYGHVLLREWAVWAVLRTISREPHSIWTVCMEQFVHLLRNPLQHVGCVPYAERMPLVLPLAISEGARHGARPHAEGPDDDSGDAAGGAEPPRDGQPDQRKSWWDAMLLGAEAAGGLLRPAADAIGCLCSGGDGRRRRGARRLSRRTRTDAHLPVELEDDHPSDLHTPGAASMRREHANPAGELLVAVPDEPRAPIDLQHVSRGESGIQAADEQHVNTATTGDAAGRGLRLEDRHPSGDDSHGGGLSSDEEEILSGIHGEKRVRFQLPDGQSDAKSSADGIFDAGQATSSNGSPTPGDPSTPQVGLAEAAHQHLDAINLTIKTRVDAAIKQLAESIRPAQSPLVRTPEMVAMRNDSMFVYTCYQDLCILNEVVGSRWYRDGICRIVGTTDSDEPRSVVGVQLGPSIVAVPTIYSSDPSNIECAIRERLTKKKKEFKPSESLIKDIRSMVWASMHSERSGDLIFSEKQIVEWGERYLWDLAELRSKKWTEQRFNAAVAQVLAMFDPEMSAKLMIKAEPMPSDANGGTKAPRLLIADGDVGTVMSTLVIRCFEHLLFTKQEDRCIKHQEKSAALQKIASALRITPQGACVEGDGSAWDTCCSEQLRELVENPVLVWIAHVLMKHFIVPDEWILAHQSFNEQAYIKGMWTSKVKSCNVDYIKKVKIVIPAIRRSGHLGTSCLNWWTNFICWHAVVFGKKARDFLNPSCKKRKDRWDVDRVCKSAFEGDDSALNFNPDLSDRRGEVEKLWESLGFNMKLEFKKRGQSLVFAGERMLLDAQGPTNEHMPDLLKFIASGAFTCSSTAIKAADEGDLATLRKLEAAKCLSRAREYAASLPRFARCLLDRAEMLNDGDFELDHDSTVRLTGAVDMPNISSSHARDIVRIKIVGSTSDDVITLHKFDMVCKEDEYSNFLTTYKKCDVIGYPDHTEWSLVVPYSWQ